MMGQLLASSSGFACDPGVLLSTGRAPPPPLEVPVARIAHWTRGCSQAPAAAPTTGSRPRAPRLEARRRPRGFGDSDPGSPAKLGLKASPRRAAVGHRQQPTGSRRTRPGHANLAPL